MRAVLTVSDALGRRKATLVLAPSSSSPSVAGRRRHLLLPCVVFARTRWPPRVTGETFSRVTFCYRFDRRPKCHYRRRRRQRMVSVCVRTWRASLGHGAAAAVRWRVVRARLCGSRVRPGRTDPTYSRAGTAKTGCPVPSTVVFVFEFIYHGHVAAYFIFNVSFSLLPEPPTNARGDRASRGGAAARRLRRRRPRVGDDGCDGGGSVYIITVKSKYLQSVTELLCIRRTRRRCTGWCSTTELVHSRSCRQIFIFNTILLSSNNILCEHVCTVL